MKLETLQFTSAEEIRHSFNEAFMDYFVPLQLSAQQMEQKLLAEGFDPSVSVGAFAQDKLAAFVLHSTGLHNGKRTAYNSGTGVIAACRGQRMVQRMYEYLLPLLKERKFEKSVLEVIQENAIARRCYEAVGFQTVRELQSFKGTVAGAAPHAAVVELTAPDWPFLQFFWSWNPSWQHSLACLKRAAGSNKTYGLYKEDQLAAYAVINPLTNRIPSFAVAPAFRNMGLATTLFRHIQHLHQEKPFTIINVDSQHQPTIEFIQRIGLKPLLTQYEMALMIH